MGDVVVKNSLGVRNQIALVDRVPLRHAPFYPDFCQPHDRDHLGWAGSGT